MQFSAEKNYESRVRKKGRGASGSRSRGRGRCRSEGANDDEDNDDEDELLNDAYSTHLIQSINTLHLLSSFVFSSPPARRCHALF